jgi:hypothetical protein
VSLFGWLGHAALLSLEITVVNDLKAAHMLLLKGPQTLLLFALFFQERLLDNLLIALMENGGLLLSIETLKVIGLNTVGCKHWGHCGGVFSHQVVSESVLKLVLLLIVPVLALLKLIITLLLSELEVLLLSCLEHGSALSLMIFLSLLKDLIEVNCLLIVGTTKS